jgi:hypothetical protein
MSEDLDLSEVGIDYWLQLLDFKRSELLGTHDVSRPRSPWAAVRERDDEAELALIQARRFNQDVERLVGRKVQEAHRAAGIDEYVLSDGTPVELGKAATREDRRAYLDGKSAVAIETRDA